MDWGNITLEGIKVLGIVAAAVTTGLNHQRLKRVSNRTKTILQQTNGKGHTRAVRRSRKQAKHVPSLGV